MNIQRKNSLIFRKTAKILNTYVRYIMQRESNKVLKKNYHGLDRVRQSYDQNESFTLPSGTLICTEQDNMYSMPGKVLVV